MSTRIHAGSLTTAQVRAGMVAHHQIFRNEETMRSILNTDTDGWPSVSIEGPNHWGLHSGNLTPGQAMKVLAAIEAAA
jgi:hypothetical protein